MCSNSGEVSITEFYMGFGNKKTIRAFIKRISTKGLPKTTGNIRSLYLLKVIILCTRFDERPENCHPDPPSMHWVGFKCFKEN